MADPVLTRSHVDEALDELLLRRTVPMFYQPVVDLAGGDVVGFEALARPEIDGIAVPIVQLQNAAARRALLGELDWICRTSAAADPGVARLPASLAWLVNAEPRAIGAPCPPDLAERLARADRASTTVVEITERAIAADLRDLLRGVGLIRGRGGRIAIDDIGVEPASLALLPVIGPDLVKLDTSLLQYLTDPLVARISGAVRAYAERTGAAVLAEGIETAEHLDIAEALGATHVQGHLLGPPGPLPASLREPRVPLPRREVPPVDDATPFEILATARPTQRAVKRLLMPITDSLEMQVQDRSEPLALLAHFQRPDNFSRGRRARYQELASRYAFVAALGVGVGTMLPSGVRGGDILPGDPIRDEWCLVVLGPHFAAALAARDIGDSGPDGDRRYDYVVTHDRQLVERVARAMAARLLP